jgi:hypothetical protein
MLMVVVMVVMVVDAVRLQRRQLADLLWRLGYRCCSDIARLLP